MQHLVRHLRCREEFHGWTRREVRTILQILRQSSLEHFFLLVDSIFQSGELTIVLAKFTFRSFIVLDATF